MAEDNTTSSGQGASGDPKKPAAKKAGAKKTTKKVVKKAAANGTGKKPVKKVVKRSASGKPAKATKAASAKKRSAKASAAGAAGGSTALSAKGAQTKRGPAGRRPGDKKKKKTSPWVKRGIWGTLGLLIAAPFIAFFIAYVVTDVPKPGELVTKQITKIYASDAETELARLVPAEGNRQEVPLEQIPEITRNAVLAAEDREFYSNSGFSFTGFARAALGQITGNTSAGGGSTITQQYVKNMVVGNDYSYMRKAKELVYSVKMTNEWDKDTILEAYLNTIYFGRNAYGIDAAARAYFGIPAAELNAEQSALLAGAIQRPSQLDPWVNKEESVARWNYVLDGMVEIGALTAQQRQAAQWPQTTDPATNQAYTEAEGANGHIKNKVIQELTALGISEDDVQTKGLRVTTSIDTKVQQATVDAVRNNLAGENDNLRMAAVSIDPRTGAVKGYYGGEEATGYDYANAALQTGSTFKIVTVAAALQQGIPTSAIYSSEPFQLPGGITVGSVNGATCGSCSVAEALKQSFNPSFLRLQESLENGTQDTADMGHALGIAKSLPGIPETLTENGNQPYEGITLGQYDSRPLDMAQVMATLANYGVYHEHYFVSKVETASGETLFERGEQPAERRVSEKVATNLLEAMAPIAGWSGYNDLAGGRPSASKTGTTQLGDTGYNKDAWMIGATPQLATAVWTGTEDNSPLLTAWGGQMYGSGVPASTWKDIQDAALEGEEIEYFKPAEPLGYGASSYYNTVPTQSWVGSAGTATETAGAETSAPGSPAAPSDAAPAPGGEAPAPGGEAPAPEPAPAPAAPADPIGDLIDQLGL